MQSRLKHGLFWGLCLVLVALYIATMRPDSSAGLATAPSVAGPGPASGVQLAKELPSEVAESATKPAGLAEGIGTRARGSGILSRPALDWYRAALVPTASVRERTIAVRIHVLCAQLRSARETYEERRTASKRPALASAPGVSAEELADLNLRNVQAAPPEQGAELQRLGDYCREGAGFNLMSELRKSSVRPTEYFELALADRPLAGRFAVVVGVLSNPKANAPEFTIWADRGLREVFVQGHGLSELQAWHASNWLVREVLGDSEEVDFFARTQCAVHGFCRSANLLTDADRQSAEQAAHQVLADLQRQEWSRLILKRP